MDISQFRDENDEIHNLKDATARERLTPNLDNAIELTGTEKFNKTFDSDGMLVVVGCYPNGNATFATITINGFKIAQGVSTNIYSAWINVIWQIKAGDVYVGNNFEQSNGNVYFIPLN